MQKAVRAAPAEGLLRIQSLFKRLASLLSIWATVAGAHAYAQNITSERPESAPNADTRLPLGAPVRITIRYPVENAAARQRANDLARGLSGQGLNVADPVASLGHIASNTVSYFYAEDRPGAEIAARVLGPAWKTVQQRFPTREPFPGPGTLELAVAGP